MRERGVEERGSGRKRKGVRVFTTAEIRENADALKTRPFALSPFRPLSMQEGSNQSERKNASPH